MPILRLVLSLLLCRRIGYLTGGSAVCSVALSCLVLSHYSFDLDLLLVLPLLTSDGLTALVLAFLGWVHSRVGFVNYAFQHYHCYVFAVSQSWFYCCFAGFIPGLA